jgi:biotin carboxyl carrier protein
MAGVRRLRVTDRASGIVLGEIEAGPALAVPGGPDPAGSARRTLVLPLGPSVATGPTSGVRQAIEVVIDGWRFELDVEDADRADLRARATRDRDAAAHGGPIEVRAIIPGRVVSVAVNPGDAVTAGDRLLAVEAMKMENEVRAPRDGVVERVAVGPGDTVELGDVLVVLR